MICMIRHDIVNAFSILYLFLETSELMCIYWKNKHIVCGVVHFWQHTSSFLGGDIIYECPLCGFNYKKKDEGVFLTKVDTITYNRYKHSTLTWTTYNILKKMPLKESYLGQRKHLFCLSNSQLLLVGILIHTYLPHLKF